MIEEGIPLIGLLGFIVGAYLAYKAKKAIIAYAKKRVGY